MSSRLNKSKSSKTEMVSSVVLAELSTDVMTVNPLADSSSTTTPTTTGETKKAKRSSKSKSKPVEVPVVSTEPPATLVSSSVVPVVVEQTSTKSAESVVDTVQEDTVEVGELDLGLTEQSVEFLLKLQQLGVIISSLKTEYRLLEKKWSRELKTANKQSARRRRKTVNRAPSGFVKPTRISDELAGFLEKPSGSEMARTEVTRDINKYIRSNNLQDKDNGRKINPDNKLASLLKITGTEELTYFNLQRYMSPHFAKATKEVATVV